METRVSLALLLAACCAHCARSVEIKIDYSYDASGFFDDSTPNGAAAKAAIEQAATFLSGLLGDTFDRIETPNDYLSTAPFGDPVSYSWDWTMRFQNPSSGQAVLVSNPTIPADEFRVYVGARDLPGDAIGLAGPGSYSVNASGSYYYDWQLAEIQAITDSFFGSLSNRNEPEGEFGRWGGVVTIDSNSPWNYEANEPPSSGENDLYSVLIHEMLHTLGYGEESASTTTVWESLVEGGSFSGDAASAEWGSAVPLSGDLSHWADGTQSVVYDGFVQQEASLTPSIGRGARKLLTTLDAAALTDLGWQVAAETKLPGDYNFDGRVDAADYTLWRDNLDGPTPTGSFAGWASNYGQSAAANTAIPEPPAGFTLALLLAAWRRR